MINKLFWSVISTDQNGNRDYMDDNLTKIQALKLGKKLKEAGHTKIFLDGLTSDPEDGDLMKYIQIN